MLRGIAYCGALLCALNAGAYAIKVGDPGWVTWLGAAVLCFVSFGASHAWWAGAKVARAGHPLAGWLIAIVLTCGVVITLAAGMGGVSTQAAARKASEKQAQAMLGENKERLAELRAKRAALPATRIESVIEGDIAALKRDRRYDLSKQCKEATNTDSRDLCAKLDKLVGEQAALPQLKALDQEIEGYAKLVSGAGTEAFAGTNEATRYLARLLGISGEDAAAVYAFGVSVALEVTALAFMLAAELTKVRPKLQETREAVGVGTMVQAKEDQALAVEAVDVGALMVVPSKDAQARRETVIVTMPAVAEASLNETNVVVADQSPVVARMTNDGRREGRIERKSSKRRATAQRTNAVEGFANECLMPADGSIEVDALYRAYGDWSREKGLAVVPFETFGAELIEFAAQFGLEFTDAGGTIAVSGIVLRSRESGLAA